MKITVNDQILEVSGKRTLIEELRAAGYDIPSLCYAAGAKHQPSCMVCMVRDTATDQMIPSCSTYPVEGMSIDTESEDLLSMRRMSLELLLSDHRADCEGPCTIVCPSKIDVAKVLFYYDRGQMAQARGVLASAVDVEHLPCATCKALCEKACRRRTVDEAVSIREIVAEVAACPTTVDVVAERETAPAFTSKLGRYQEAEKAWLRDTYNQSSRCLHCACEGKSDCKLRAYAAQAGIKSSRYGVSSHQQVKVQQHVTGKLYFEPAKCIRCGLCVHNTQDGFTFQRRGFDMQVIIPEQSKSHVDESLARLCPTGALFLKEDKQ